MALNRRTLCFLRSQDAVDWRILQQDWGCGRVARPQYALAALMAHRL